MTTAFRNKLACLTGTMALALLLTACGEDRAADAVASDADTGKPAEVVVPGNTAPVLDGEPLTVHDVDADYTFQPSVYDAEGDPLTFSAQGLPSWATLDPSTGRITGRPSDADEGETAEIVLQVTDGWQTAELKSFKITVRGKNETPSVSGQQPPTIRGTPSAIATVNATYSFTPAASDPDTARLTFSIKNKPSWASFSSSTGTLSGKPATRNVGTTSNIVISVTDGKTQVSLPAFSIQVQPAPNGAPVISGTPSGSASVGAAYSFTPTASDPEKQTLGFSISGKPSWANFSTSTGALTGVPGAGNVGTFGNIVITVSDGKLQASLPPFAITVSAAANGAPTISGTPPTSVAAGASYNFLPSASDPNGDKLTFSISNKPSWANFDATNGRLSGTATAGLFSNVTISVSDGKTTTSLPTFSIQVSAASVGSATLTWTPPTQNTDGSALTNLAGYRIYYGTSPTALTQSIQITNPGLTSYTVGNLQTGTYYFALAAYTTDGVEGTQSSVGSKTIM